MSEDEKPTIYGVDQAEFLEGIRTALLGPRCECGSAPESIIHAVELATPGSEHHEFRPRKIANPEFLA